MGSTHPSGGWYLGPSPSPAALTTCGSNPEPAEEDNVPYPSFEKIDDERIYKYEGRQN